MTPLFTFSGFIKARESTTPGGGERRSRQKKQTQKRGFSGDKTRTQGRDTQEEQRKGTGDGRKQR